MVSAANPYHDQNKDQNEINMYAEYGAGDLTDIKIKASAT
jgi:hypothetical protein